MEAQRRAEEEKERERLKEEKKAAKERRRKEYEAQQATGLRKRPVDTAQETTSPTPGIIQIDPVCSSIDIAYNQQPSGKEETNNPR